MTADVTEAQSIIDAALACAEAQPIDTDEHRLYSVVIPAGGTHKVVDVEEYLDRFRPNPRRKTGTVAIHDAATFIAYLGKHATDDTEVWADLDKQTIVAVINAHGPANDVGLPGHGDFRARLALTHTPAWLAWAALDGKLLTQLAFAEHIENRLPDIFTPTGAEMLEVAQSFQAKRNLSFESSRSLSTGQVQLEYREEIKDTAGRKGNLSFPREIVLQLLPYVGGPAYKVPTRLRYRIDDATLRIGYQMNRPEEVLSSAFSDVLEQVEAGITSLVFRGTPTG